MEFVIIGLIILCVFLVIVALTERMKRQVVEQELKNTKEVLKRTSEILVKKNNEQAQSTYEAHFGHSVKHLGEEFLEECE